MFWGGREGYMTLLNTDMKREKEHLAIFLNAAKDYARRSGFKGSFFIGNLGLVQNGDMIELDVEKRKLHLHVPDEELAKRRAASIAPSPQPNEDM